jgi:crotonobetainyl-CoA:carnitine CoA-transferase CaiB-like acyl-CoA transferase
MNSPEDLFECPHLKAVDMFPEIEHPTEGRIKHIKVPAAFSKTPGGLYHHSEKLGASTNAVLNELGFSNIEITELESLGAITPKK